MNARQALQLLEYQVEDAYDLSPDLRKATATLSAALDERVKKLEKQPEPSLHLGMSVKITFCTTSKFVRKPILHNVTEIHYNYPRGLKPSRIAFESDIHRTGFTYDLADIREFEAKLESRLWDQV